MPPPAPSPGAIARVRQRLYLVEDTIAPTAPEDSTLVRLSCIDDDNQGQPLDVLWERELDPVLSHFEERPRTPQGNHDVRSRSAAGGYALSPGELDAVHGGELKIEVPRYIPLSESHPKTERTLPRVTLLG